MDAIGQKRFDVARLTLEALINTYPNYARRAELVLQEPRIANCGESWSTFSGCDGVLSESEPLSGLLQFF